MFLEETVSLKKKCFYSLYFGLFSDPLLTPILDSLPLILFYWSLLALNCQCQFSSGSTIFSCNLNCGKWSFWLQLTFLHLRFIIPHKSRYTYELDLYPFICSIILLKFNHGKQTLFKLTMCILTENVDHKNYY